MKKYCLFLIMAFILFGCSVQKPTLEKAIIGKWVDKTGYEIHFFTGGKGFIPGVPEKIPDSNFQYSIVDENHISIEIEDTKQTLETKIEGDNLTLKYGQEDVIYKRIKE
ncbi:MAG TPA: hypothetical protein VF338_03270 [Leptolinea sp.]